MKRDGFIYCAPGRGSCAFLNNKRAYEKNGVERSYLLYPLSTHLLPQGSQIYNSLILHLLKGDWEKEEAIIIPLTKEEKEKPKEEDSGLLF